ncbi:MAG: hypothetical protein JO191_10610 [Mycobacteriaceae bacterium]|nr:hypothetical protein [Mycobacteriaceae bacterium]MBV9512510.1 hypothetical protein [Mycobacteriaceae bacterium]
MMRTLFIAAAIAATAISAAPTAAADDPSGRYPGDVPGMNYDAALNAPCDNTDLFIFGRGRGGEPMQCHWIPNQWPPVYTGFWVSSYPLYGVHNIGEPCPNPRGAAAQSPDGIALVCTASYGWVQWV